MKVIIKMTSLNSEDVVQQDIEISSNISSTNFDTIHDLNNSIHVPIGSQNKKNTAKNSNYAKNKNKNTIIEREVEYNMLNDLSKSSLDNSMHSKDD